MMLQILKVILHKLPLLSRPVAQVASSEDDRPRHGVNGDHGSSRDADVATKEVAGSDVIRDESDDSGMNKSMEESVNSPYNPLVQLPVELLFTLVDHLDPSDTVLLSLTCKWLYYTLQTRIDLSLRGNVKARTRFLRYLEIDYPEYLTCPFCGWMYRWRCSAKYAPFECPRRLQHTPDDWRTDVRTRIGRIGSGRIDLSALAVALIVRAHARGLEHGLPATYFDGQWETGDPVLQDLEGGMVNGDFMLTTSCEVLIRPVENMSEVCWSLDHALCLHWAMNCCQRTWVRAYRIISTMTCDRRLHVAKCPYCPTDYKLVVEATADAAIKARVIVWQNLGNPISDTVFGRQIWTNRPQLRLDQHSLNSRDLESDLRRALVP